MSQPIPLRRSLLCLFLALFGVAVVRAEEPNKTLPKPAQSFLLESFGYRPSANQMALRAGYVNATVNFIDADHLLLTYAARALMKRDPAQRETDDDNTVRAVVIQLPEGKAIRTTEWRMHDRAPYLWPLASGHFLIRIRSNLYSIDPMGSTDPAHLGQQLLVQGNSQLQLVETSPLRDLLMIETTPQAKIGDDIAEQHGRPVTATFYRVTVGANGAVTLGNRGRVLSDDIFSFAFTSMGILETVQEDRTHWGFDFRSFGGKRVQLAGFTSTCKPRPAFISDAEFFAFGCRGGGDRRLMGGFNLMAEAKWVFTTDDPPVWFTMDMAPAAGRFAMRNTLANQPITDDDARFADIVKGQEIRVYGDREGDELLRVTASPTQRPAGNFALAPDGLRLAVLHDAQLEIYALPAVDAADRKLHEREMKALEPLQSSTEANIAAALKSANDAHADEPSQP